jgi:predicted exporter
LLGFGLLAFSGVPALHHFGLALATTIAGSLLLAPLSLKG